MQVLSHIVLIDSVSNDVTAMLANRSWITSEERYRSFSSVYENALRQVDSALKIQMTKVKTTFYGNLLR